MTRRPPHSSTAVPPSRRISSSARADSVDIWGTGTPRREFLYVDDLADALVFLLKHYSAEQHINIGCGSDLSIRDLAAYVARAVGFQGSFRLATDKPDGAPRKLL